MSLEVLRDYKNLEKWVNDFVKINDRQPTSHDFQAYFGVRNPPLSFKHLFDISERRDAVLEKIVKNYIVKNFSQEKIVFNSRPIRKEDNSILEIDIFLTELKIGFEVNEFLSHSKLSDSEVDRFGSLKKGPSYHELKRSLALEQLGVKIIDVWEDDIRSGAFKTIVSREIASSLTV